MDRSAYLLDRPDGKRYLVQSTQPVATTDRQGHWAPIDTHLEQGGGELRPVNPVAPVTVASHADGQNTLTGARVGFHLPDVAATNATVSDDKAFFPNALADSDLTVAPVAGGLEVLVQLRSADSPERVSIDFDLPPGARMQLKDGNGVLGSPLPPADEKGAQIIVDGRVAATVAPPAAIDADGHKVPARYELDGSRLTVVVPHHGGDFRYPILVDPYVVDYFDWRAHNGADGLAQSYGWGYRQYSSGYTFYDCSTLPGCNTNSGLNGPGLYVQGRAGSWSPNGWWGEWYFQAPRGANIVRTDWRAAGMTTWGNSCMYAYITGPTSNNSGNRYTNCSNTGAPNWWPVSCTDIWNPCATGGSASGNAAVFGLQIWNGSYVDIWAMLGGAYVNMWEGWRPSVTNITNRPGSWVHDEGRAFSAAVHDDGLGVHNAQLLIDGTIIPSQDHTLSCTGSYQSPCEPDTTFDNWSYSTTNLGEGVHRAEVQAQDVIGNTSLADTNSTFDIKVDRSGPSVALSGSLKAAEGTRIDDRNYGLHIDATDGTAGTAASERSGVKSVAIKVDGRPVVGGSWTQTCPQSNCSMSRDWTFNSERYAAGDHTIQVVATDQLNHSTLSTFTVTVVHAASADIGPGSVNLRTGDFTLDRSDAAIDSTGSGLVITRTYNSRDLGASVNSPFGPGWTPSVPVDGPTSEWIQLDVVGNLSADGVVEVTTADGDKVDFTPKPGGGFDAPEGLEDLTMTAPTGRYELKDLDGNVTVFTQPSGTPTGSTTYLPSEVRAPSGSSGAATSTVSYEFQNGAARIKQVTAPAPSGVDCTGALVRGCRALSFVYSTATTATSGSPGDYAGRVAHIDLTAYDPDAGSMSTTPILQYAYTSGGRLAAAWDPRISPALKEQYAYDTAGNLTGVTPPGEEAWTLNYAQPTKQPTDPDYPNDPNSGRLLSASRPALPGTATESVVYGVPISGAGAPYAMGSSNVAAWGQTDVPVTGTAIFPPDQVPGSQTPSDYSHATIHYLDTKGREVNQADPGGRISTTEYDNSHDNVVRELTAENRDRALSSGSSAARAVQIDTRRSYSADGTLLVDEVGPLHSVKLASGETVDARPHTQITYDQGAPAGGPYGLPTTTTQAAQIAGRPDADTRTKTTSYGGQGGLGWTLRSPTSETVDPGGLNLTTTTLYDAATGQVTETRQPANPAGGDAHAKQRIYYSATASDAACTGRPESSGLLCKEKPAAQPGTPGLPDLAITTYTYNRLGEQRATTETIGATAQRTTSITYDSAGRPLSTAISSTEGDPVPTVTTGYDATTGRATTTTTQTQAGAVSVVRRQFDTLGRLTSYTDADGNVSTATYDIDGRPVTSSDGKGTQTYTYDSVTGDRTQIADSGVGTMTATYDRDGQLKTETLPGGLQQQMTYDETGQATRVGYVKTTNCSSNCTWLDSNGARSIQDQWATNTGTLSNQSYTYDRAGRLTEARDTPSGGSCTVRSYSYDADTNRTLSVSHPAAVDGSCAPASAGSSVSHSYDGADRLTDSGVTYDSFSRETSLSSNDNAGKGSLALTYFANDLTQSIRQGTTTKVFSLDPGLRQRTAQTVGGDGQTRTFHYSNDTDSPSWMTESTDGVQWSRPVEGFDGDLAVMQSESGVKLMLTNLHGDVVAETSTSPSATGLTKTYEADEFGIPKSTGAGRFAWLGANERRTEFPDSGVISMGVRTYIPGLGRFSSPDPIEGGSANDYDYGDQDPVNNTDLSGTTWDGPHHQYHPPSRVLRAWRFFRRRGLTKAGAAGLIGNLRQESHLRTKIRGAGGARGIAQWESPRWHQLLDWAHAKNKKPFSFATQLQFVWHELTTSYRQTLRILRHTHYFRRATRRVMRFYEIAGVEHVDVRLKCAMRTLRNPRGRAGGQC